MTDCRLDARRVLLEAIDARVFPAAVVEVGAAGGVLWCDAAGTLTFDKDSAPATADTIFDLASLTKVIVTASLAMQLVYEDRLTIEDPIASFFPEWRGPDREAATVQDLLEHASGLAARLVDAPPRLRREFEHDICTMPLEYAPRSQSIYSDLGFILLGFLVEDRAGASLAAAFDEVRLRLAAAEAGVSPALLSFNPDVTLRSRAAPTVPLEGDARRGRILAGEVHDNYAAALTGVAGHAGLFGSASAVGAFARAVLRGARGDDSIPPPLSPPLVARAVKKSTVPNSSRAIGWDTMLPTSSCGARMSPRAFGHAGFTGTSMWIDPERDRYFVLLANRTFGGGTLDEMRTVRRAFHDALADI